MRMALVKENEAKESGRQQKPEPCVTGTHAGKARAAILNCHDRFPCSLDLSF
jgi:hypothetical protein